MRKAVGAVPIRPLSLAVRVWEHIEGMNGGAPRASIVIPSYGQGEMIVRCLSSFMGELPALDCDVWVVDSSPQDITPLLQDYLTDPRFHLIRCEERLFPGAARDLGIKSSRGRTIVFIDCDCLAQPGWPRGLLDALESAPELAACGGGVENGTPCSYWGTAEYLSEFGEFTPRSQAGWRRFVPTCNMALRRSAYFEVGGLDADMEKGSDVALGREFIRRGMRIYFLPGTSVLHFNSAGFLDFMRKQFKIGGGSARNFLTGRQPYSRWKDSRLMRTLLAIGAGPLRFVRVVGRILRQRELSIVRIASFLPGLLMGAVSFGVGYAYAFFELRDR